MYISELYLSKSFFFWVTLNLFYSFSFRNPLLVLDCCLTVSRGGRRVLFVHYLHFYIVCEQLGSVVFLNWGFYGFQRFGNIAGLFQVMSVAIQALDKGDVDHNYLAKLAKIATSEVISTKVEDTPLCCSLCSNLFVSLLFLFSPFQKGHLFPFLSTL